MRRTGARWRPLLGVLLLLLLLMSPATLPMHGVTAAQADLGSPTTLTIPTSHGDGAAAAVANKALFAGGTIGNFQGTSAVVDVYDTISATWSSAALSQARNALSALSSGGKVFFAGGRPGNGTDAGNTTAVDIYDSQSNTWSTAALSAPRHYITSVAVGSKVLFAGGWDLGGRTTIVDIYDSPTNTWTTATLAQPTSGHFQATSVGSLALIASDNLVNIYNSQSATWSTAPLSQPRTIVAAVTIGTKALFAGGYTPSGVSSRVDIFDSSTNTWTTANLSQARGDIGPAVLGAKAYFFGGWTGSSGSAMIDIYDSTTNTWTSSLLPGAAWGLQPVVTSSRILLMFQSGGTAWNIVACLQSMSSGQCVMPNSNNRIVILVPGVDFKPPFSSCPGDQCDTLGRARDTFLDPVKGSLLPSALANLSGRIGPITRQNMVPFSYAGTNVPTYTSADTRQRVAISSQVLMQYVAVIKQSFPGTKLHIIGHSLGGVITAYALQQPPLLNDSSIEAAIAVDSPLRGVKDIIYSFLGRSLGLADTDVIDDLDVTFPIKPHPVIVAVQQAQADPRGRLWSVTNNNDVPIPCQTAYIGPDGQPVRGWAQYLGNGLAQDSFGHGTVFTANGGNAITAITQILQAGDLTGAPASQYDRCFKDTEVTFVVLSPADLLVTDPNGRRTGYDPITRNVVNEIPGSVYTGPGTEPQLVAINTAMAGQYVVGLTGTALGRYTLIGQQGSGFSTSATSVEGTISPGERVGVTFQGAGIISVATHTPTATATLIGTPSATPTPTVTLTPGSNISVSVVPSGAGRLQANIAARMPACTPNNQLQSLRFEAGSNVAVEIDGQFRSLPFSVTLPAGTTQKSFTIIQLTSGQAATVSRLVAVDSCGEWVTLVGGGPEVFQSGGSANPASQQGGGAASPTGTPTRTRTPTATPSRTPER